MSRNHATSGTRKIQYACLALFAVGVLLLVYLAFDRVEGSRPAAGATPNPIPTFGEAQPAEPLALPGSGARVVIIGDSWTGGYASDPGQGYADTISRAMGWEATIVAASGSGYVSNGGGGVFQDVVAGAEPDATAQLVIIQGGLNDAYVPREGERAAAEATLSAAEQAFPAADIVVVGPASPSFPVRDELREVNTALGATATDGGVFYVSPLDEGWITEANAATLIDSTKGDHPNNAGHALYADKLESALRALAEV